MTSVFFSYSHADEPLRDQLDKHLATLKRQGLVDAWHDRKIGAGADFGSAIDSHVEEDDIILLLVSPDFLASDYCYEREMTRAMTRHESGEAIVIPVILRACDWQYAPFGKLNATPKDGVPISQWPDRDQALLEVAKAVRAATEKFGERIGVKREHDFAKSEILNDQERTKFSKHRKQISDLLDKIWRSAQKSNEDLHNFAFFTFISDDAYVQALINAGEKAVLLEVVPAHYAPQLWKRLDKRSPSRLADLGFAAPEADDDLYRQTVQLYNKNDFERVVDLLTKAFDGVLEVDPTIEPEVVLDLCN